MTLTGEATTMVARILLVEDDEASRELATFLLEHAGYRVSIAHDGAQGVQIALDERPDLVISDLQMPRVNGFELARRLLDDPQWRRVPLVAVSAFSMRGDRETALAAGFDGYLAKPITPETFVQEIAAFLPPAQHAAPPPPDG